MPKKITNEHIWHRQQLRKQRPEFIIKTKYRRNDIDEVKAGYDWKGHREAISRLSPKQYLET
jgi:hypothetical protein